MVYLESIPRFCRYWKEIKFQDGEFFDGKEALGGLPGFIYRVTEMYEVSETSYYIDTEFEYIAKQIYVLRDKFDCTDDVGYLMLLVHVVFDQMTSNQRIEDLMSRLYWRFLKDDK